MNNAESNEPKDTQAQRAGESPVKVPETETAHVKVQDAVKAASGQEAGLGQPGGSGASKSGYAGTADGPLGLTTGHPVGQDVLNDGSLDDTVDTDGKNRDAKRDMEMRERDPDSVIISNATLVNYVREPGDGLGGFDSRPGRNGLLLALERGYRMIDKGLVAPQVTDVEHRLQFEEHDPHGHTLRGRKHYALNHMRPSRLIELQRGDK
jgi:hypothetical protein